VSTWTGTQRGERALAAKAKEQKQKSKRAKAKAKDIHVIIGLSLQDVSKSLANFLVTSYDVSALPPR